VLNNRYLKRYIRTIVVTVIRAAFACGEAAFLSLNQDVKAIRSDRRTPVPRACKPWLTSASTWEVIGILSAQNVLAVADWSFYRVDTYIAKEFCTIPAVFIPGWRKLVGMF
jgi:hypothetical protein